MATLDSSVIETQTRAYNPDWESLLRPKGIALVGASERNDFAAKFVVNNAQFGYAGRILFVNPNRQSVFDQPCYPDLAALPERPDCVVISVPAPHVTAIITQALELGVRALVIHSAGFAESNAEGLEAQNRIQAICREANVGVIGPNCLGLINVKDGVGLYGAPIPPTLPRGNVGVVAQSGSASIVLMNNARDLGFSYIASTGNEAVLTAEDLIDHYIDDPDTHVIVVFLEGLRQPRRFVSAAQRALAAGKPIIVLKVGLTPRGGKVSQGHTGALAGSGRVHEAVFRQLGVVQVFDFDELVETATLFSRTRRLPSGSRTAVLGISGGELALVADMAERLALPLPEYTPETTTAVRETLSLPDFITTTNPLDVGAGFRAIGYEEKYYRSLVSVGQDPNIDIVAISQDAQSVFSQGQVAFYQQITRATARGSAALEKPVVFFSHLSAGFHPEIVAVVRESGLPLLQGTRESMLAIKALGSYAARRRDLGAGNRPKDYQADRTRINQALAGLSPGQSLVGERAAKRLLAAYGIPVTRDNLATNANKAAEIAEAMGFPVVLKIESSDIVHKSEVGGVRLQLSTREQVKAAFAEIIGSARARRPDANIQGVVVAQQVPPGVELIVGVKQDPHFGPVVMIGLGGVLVEVLDQVALALPPLSREEALRLLAEMPGHQTLSAFRGRPAADVQAVADVLVSVGQLALDGEGLIDELDINPLIAGGEGQGCRAVDARLLLAH